jgi:hypothetical protein
MTTTFKPDAAASDGDIPGVDRHYYENQVGPSSLTDDTHAFRLAAAVAKDTARHQLIRAVRKANEDARANSLTGLGKDTISDSIYWTRSIDGVEGASDDAIKL